MYQRLSSIQRVSTLGGPEAPWGSLLDLKRMDTKPKPVRESQEMDAAASVCAANWAGSRPTRVRPQGVLECGSWHTGVLVRDLAKVYDRMEAVPYANPVFVLVDAHTQYNIFYFSTAGREAEALCITTAALRTRPRMGTNPGTRAPGYILDMSAKTQQTVTSRQCKIHDPPSTTTMSYSNIK